MRFPSTEKWTDNIAVKVWRYPKHCGGRKTCSPSLLLLPASAFGDEDSVAKIACWLDLQVPWRRCLCTMPPFCRHYRLSSPDLTRAKHPAIKPNWPSKEKQQLLSRIELTRNHFKNKHIRTPLESLPPFLTLPHSYFCQRQLMATRTLSPKSPAMRTPMKMQWNGPRATWK